MPRGGAGARSLGTLEFGDVLSTWSCSTLHIQSLHQELLQEKHHIFHQGHFLPGGGRAVVVEVCVDQSPLPKPNEVCGPNVVGLVSCGNEGHELVKEITANLAKVIGDLHLRERGVEAEDCRL